MNSTDLVDRAYLRDDVPDFAAGDTLKVHVRVVEGNRERVQLFQGAVIRRQGSGIRETLTVRKMSFGVGVERTFAVHSPILSMIEVVTRGDVRRAKLYYLRDRIGKAVRLKERYPKSKATAAETAAVKAEKRAVKIASKKAKAEAKVEAAKSEEPAKPKRIRGAKKPAE